MERLTYYERGYARYDFGGVQYQNEIATRLAEYEDTGLEPEICAEYKKFEDEAVSKNVTFARIVELMNAEAEGRMVVLPCKVGDTVYTIWDGAVRDNTVTDLVIDYFGIHILAQYNCGGAIRDYRKDCLGKTIFLTREEAEAKLKQEVEQ